MPSRERRLKKEAMDAFKARGHVCSKRWSVWGYNKNVFLKYCRKCYCVIQVTPNPAPNNIEISGSAVALDCKD